MDLEGVPLSESSQTQKDKHSLWDPLTEGHRAVKLLETEVDGGGPGPGGGKGKSVFSGDSVSAGEDDEVLGMDGVTAGQCCECA